MGALKKPECTPTPSPKAKPKLEDANNVVQKAEIERMKKVISEKIKDPELARKAALIITDMLK